MGLIPADKIAELRDRTDIVQVISAYVSLRRAGANNWKGLCPFHEEKSPSFNVHAGRQLFHCFGCGASGDAIRFLMDHEKRDFLDVVRDLAQRAGMALPETTSREQAKQASERERLLEVNQAACRYFERMLKVPDAENGSARARAYLQSRGIGAETLEKFRIGYAPGGWDHLQTFLLKEGLPVSRAEQLGLVGISAQGRRYDFFRDRIILPVLGRSGEVVAFGSRLMDPDAKERKYVNSPDSLVYHKKDHLYGLHAAREAIRKRGRALLVEGNFDVLALHQAGVEEAVAPMGTALTPDQVSLLHRFAPTLVIAFDGDPAGRKATAGAVELLAKMGIPGRVVALPDGSDPDDFVRSEHGGPERFEGLVSKAQSSIEFYLDQLINQAEATVDGRLAMLERAKPLLLSLPDPVARDMYTKYVSMKLGMDSALVQRTLRGAPMPKPRDGSRPHNSNTNGPAQAAPTRQQMDEARLVAILLACPDLSSQALSVRAELHFHDHAMAQLLDHVLDLITKQGHPNPADVLEEAPAQAKRTLSAALMEDVASERAFHECVKRLRTRHLSEELEELRRAYQAAPTEELLAKVTETARKRSLLRESKGERP